MRREQGFGAIAAIVVLVILASLAAAIVSVSTTQQITSAQDVQAARAWQAARAGNEWGLYKVLKEKKACSSISPTTFAVDAGFYVTVRCTAYPDPSVDAEGYREGESVPGSPNRVRVYRIESIACPAATGCPVLDASAAGAGYVERRRVVLATDQ